MEISLRQFYAGIAMHAFLSGPERYDDNQEWVAAQSLLMADELIRKETVTTTNLKEVPVKEAKPAEPEPEPIEEG